MGDLIGLIVALVTTLIFLLLGWLVGTAREKAHYRSIFEREAYYFPRIMVTNLKSFPGGVDLSKGSTILMSEAVIASDYLKNFYSSFRKLVGGRMMSYESMLDRARREVVLRLCEQAFQMGYDGVCNLRIDTADIAGAANNAKAMKMASITGTGTAYKRTESA